MTDVHKTQTTLELGRAAKLIAVDCAHLGRVLKNEAFGGVALKVEALADIVAELAARVARIEPADAPTPPEPHLKVVR